MQFMTPLPGTRLWQTMESQGRIAANSFPDDWKYYTFNIPVANYMHLSRSEIIDEFTSCFAQFYSLPRIFRRSLASFARSRRPFASASNLVANLIYWRNLKLERETLRRFDLTAEAHQKREHVLQSAGKDRGVCTEIRASVAGALSTGSDVSNESPAAQAQALIVEPSVKPERGEAGYSLRDVDAAAEETSP